MPSPCTGSGRFTGTRSCSGTGPLDWPAPEFRRFSRKFLREPLFYYELSKWGRRRPGANAKFPARPGSAVALGDRATISNLGEEVKMKIANNLFPARPARIAGLGDPVENPGGGGLHVPRGVCQSAGKRGRLAGKRAVQAGPGSRLHRPGPGRQRQTPGRPGAGDRAADHRRGLGGPAAT